MSKKPNIILINCDDMGYGDLGCYGSKVNKTPALDKMADEGIVFTDFYMASSLCTPSRGAMMTGCYPKRIGFDSFYGRGVLFPGDGIGLNPDEITFAKLLKEQGYATKIIGKWHCGDQKEFLPTNHGFDSYYGIPYSNDMGRQEGIDFPPLPLMRDEEVIQIQPDQASLTERYVEEAVRFIRENKTEPFLLYFAHFYVHLPLYVPERFMKQSENGRYGAAVECVDWSVSVILHELKMNGIDENTLVIFTSDNGSRCGGDGGNNGKLQGVKGTSWEGGHRVPCIMRWPAAIPAGQVCSAVATAMDFYPTFTHIADGEVPSGRIIDGKDIQSLMYGKEDAESPHECFFYYTGNCLEAVRCGDWKLHIAKYKKEWKALFNLKNDVSEQINVYDQFPEIVEKLNLSIEKMRMDLGDMLAGVEGCNCRSPGRVEGANPIVEYDENHPYIIAMYDLKERCK